MSWISVAWDWYKQNGQPLTPLFTLGAGGLVAWAALRQAAIAARRHETQTDADRERRITESFSKAVEQLSSEKRAIRLGGIYLLERISRESERDYWPIMETLTAFVREYTPPEAGASSDPSAPAQYGSIRLAADVQAALTVLARRDEKARNEDEEANRSLNLMGVHIKGANLMRAHLERANLGRANLEGVNLREAHLEHAELFSACLKSADLRGAHLEQANLNKAHLKNALLNEVHLEGSQLDAAQLQNTLLAGANLKGAKLFLAHLEGADLSDAELKRARLSRALLNGANLGTARNLTQRQIEEATGDDRTILPEGLVKPAHWIQQKAEETESGDYAGP